MGGAGAAPGRLRGLVSCDGSIAALASAQRVRT